MINLDDFAILRDNKDTLKELSKDDHDENNIVYFIDSQEEAIDFDKVKRLYANGLDVSEDNVYSIDAISSEGELIRFIEFKNGRVENRNVKDKIRDSLLMFCDITETNLSFIRDNVEFVLIYNEERNPISNQEKKRRIAPSRTKIAKTLTELGNGEFIRFDLERFKKIFFRDVHTYTKDEFEKNILKKEQVS